MADERIHTNGFDCEIWRAGDEIWFVHRGRTLPVMAMAWWFTLGATAWLAAIGCGLIVVLTGERGNWIIATILLVLAAVWLTARGLRSRRTDQALKGLPFRELPHVLVDQGRAELRDAAGDRWPLSGVRLESKVADMSDYLRYELYLVWADKQFEIFYSQKPKELLAVEQTVRELGVTKVESRAS